MHFPGIMTNLTRKKNYNIFSATNLCNSYFTRALMHAVCNTRLAPVTACGAQSTARGIELDEED